MNWDKGYSAAFYAHIVDPVTWTDGARIDLTGGQVSRDKSELRQSASFDTAGFDGERWIRLYLDAKQGDDGAHVPLFTGLTATPERHFDGSREKTPVTCYSVLKPADDILLPYGWYAPAGVPVGGLIKDLITGPAPFQTEEETPVLKAPIIAEDGETRLTMIDKIVEATGWQLIIEGDGTIVYRRPPEEADITFSREYDSIENAFEVSQDWYTAPNCVMVTDDDLTATAKDEDPESPYSIPARGREVWLFESNADLSEGETLAEFALRLLKEKQAVATEVTYTRRFEPDLQPGDMVRMEYANLQGTYRIESQDIDLGYSARTKEKTCKI